MRLRYVKPQKQDEIEQGEHNSFQFDYRYLIIIYLIVFDTCKIFTLKSLNLVHVKKV